jgi:hypothetical protein
MIEETPADANRPSHYVKFGATDGIGIPSSEPLSPVRVAERARIVLLAASGQEDKEIAAVIAITPKKVSRSHLGYRPFPTALLSPSQTWAGNLLRTQFLVRTLSFLRER